VAILSKLAIFVAVLALPMLFVKSAYAYIDPGTGSMIVQAIIAALVAIGASIGIFWNRVRSLFGRLFGRKNSEGQSSNED
jgi:hypothetical protein